MQVKFSDKQLQKLSENIWIVYRGGIQSTTANFTKVSTRAEVISELIITPNTDPLRPIPPIPTLGGSEDMERHCAGNYK